MVGLRRSVRASNAAGAAAAGGVAAAAGGAAPAAAAAAAAAAAHPPPAAPRRRWPRESIAKYSAEAAFEALFDKWVEMPAFRSRVDAGEAISARQILGRLRQVPAAADLPCDPEDPNCLKGAPQLKPWVQTYLRVLERRFGLAAGELVVVEGMGCCVPGRKAGAAEEAQASQEGQPVTTPSEAATEAVTEAAGPSPAISAICTSPMMAGADEPAGDAMTDQGNALLCELCCRFETGGGVVSSPAVVAAEGCGGTSATTPWSSPRLAASRLPRSRIARPLAAPSRPDTPLAIMTGPEADEGPETGSGVQHTPDARKAAEKALADVKAATEQAAARVAHVEREAAAAVAGLRAELEVAQQRCAALEDELEAAREQESGVRGELSCAATRALARAAKTASHEEAPAYGAAGSSQPEMGAEEARCKEPVAVAAQVEAEPLAARRAQEPAASFEVEPIPAQAEAETEAKAAAAAAQAEVELQAVDTTEAEAATTAEVTAALVVAQRAELQEKQRRPALGDRTNQAEPPAVSASEGFGSEQEMLDVLAELDAQCIQQQQGFAVFKEAGPYVVSE